MASAVVMPRQGQSVETCFITGWQKSKGDKVEKGDILFSYETDKAAFDQEAQESGVLLEILYNEGDEVPVLETVAIIGQPGEEYQSLIPGKAGSAESDDVPEEKPAGDMSAEDVADRPDPGGIDSGEALQDERYKKTAGVGERQRVSPLARKLATEHNLSLSNIKGTGPLGRIIGRDIKNASSGMKGQKEYEAPQEQQLLKSTDPPDYRSKSASGTGTALGGGEGFIVERLSNMRRIIAGKMEQSLHNSAQLTHHMSADARKILAWRKQIKARMGEKGISDISLNDMVCYAVAKALKKHPYMNSHFMGDSIRVYNKIHLGIAVDTERGLMVPVLRDADDMNIRGMAERIRSLAESCRKGNIDPGLLESEAASFTVTNLGVYGVEMFTPVLNLPQVGILGVNTITYRPADTGDGVIGFVPMIGLSLTYDHRAVDGAPASVFLAEVKKEIENIESSVAIN